MIMNTSENILIEFTSFVEKSAAVMLGHQEVGMPDTNLTGGGQPPNRNIDAPAPAEAPAAPKPAKALKPLKF